MTRLAIKINLYLTQRHDETYTEFIMTTTDSNDVRMTLDEARRYIESLGRPVCYRTILRWCSDGLYEGRAVLATTMLGRLRLTTRRWIDEFFDACRECYRAERQAAEALPSPRDRQRRLRAARRKLTAMGGM